MHDVLVPEPRGGLGLALESRHEQRLVREVRVQYLHRHALPEVFLDGLVHLAHAAGPERAHEAEATAHELTRSRSGGVHQGG